MSYGLQIFNGSNVSRLGPGDFIHNLVYTGLMSFTTYVAGEGWISENIVISGIQPTAEWFATWTVDYNIAIVRIKEGYIKGSSIYRTDQYSPPITFSIYRR